MKIHIKKKMCLTVCQNGVQELHMLLLIDNFDSFTYNLKQYFQMLGADVKVIRNDALTVTQCLELHPSRVVISPGPGTPADAGISKNLIRACCGKIPLFGVCLGMQAIAEVFGGRVIRSDQPTHGKTSAIKHQGCGVFRNLPDNFQATRYHSLIVERTTLPKSLQISAETAKGEIMGLYHRDFLVEGVQFHPESILTEGGLKLLENFLYYSYEPLVKEKKHV